MTIPGEDSLIPSLESLLDGFDPTGLVFLGIDGKWAKHPTSRRGRISNEVWFRLWQARHAGLFDYRARQLFSPLVRDEASWQFTLCTFTVLNPEIEQKPGDPIVVSDVACTLIEYEACSEAGKAYVPEWDSAGKARVRAFTESAKALREAIGTGLSRERGSDKLAGTLDELKADEGAVFTQVSKFVAEEEAVRWRLEDLLKATVDARRKDEAYDLMSEQIRPAIMGSTRFPQALLRPCMELLLNPDVDISSGLQYEASDIIGRFKDVRSTETLLEAFDRFDGRYASIRSNLIFALGNLRQRRALSRFAGVLEGPDSIRLPAGEHFSGYTQPLHEEKCEAIWALGKMGADAVEVVSSLVKLAASPDRNIRTYLAWAIGRIGHGQKDLYGGLDAQVLITLMNLLTSKDGVIFEEAASALRSLGLPDFLHALYLRDFAAASMLSLKPSSTGLYELSETLLHLAPLKRPVVMAVTGDSGTGKTYFCRAIASGFGEIRAEEILYLMRDRPGDKTLDRILGIRWLREHVEPKFYEAYPVSDNEDDPERFFDELLRKHADKKLIILDGWRDEIYFHQVIKRFYDKGFLDVLVRFQTTFSTRRLNLEEREDSLENVKVHLPLIEDPAIEETRFYREGAVLIYDLDNSIPSRLTGEEILEVFRRKKITAWGDQIRIGDFKGETIPLEVRREVLSVRSEHVRSEEMPLVISGVSEFTPREATFSRTLNEDADAEPNLLEVVETGAFAVGRIAFYTQGQVACSGLDGTVGVMVGLNDRIFYTRPSGIEISHLAVAGSDIFSIDVTGKLSVTSFHEGSRADLGEADVGACSIASYRDSGALTGHEDGSVKIWDLRSRKVRILRGHTGPVLAVAADRRGRVYSGDEGGVVRLWDVERGETTTVEVGRTPVGIIGIYPDGRVVTGSGNAEAGSTHNTIRLISIDADGGTSDVFAFGGAGLLGTLTVYFDGRVLAGLRTEDAAASEGDLVVSDLRPGLSRYGVLSGHGRETRDCITMGPRVITSGSDRAGHNAIRIWGTAAYVSMEREKLRLMPRAMGKPPYYRSLF